MAAVHHPHPWCSGHFGIMVEAFCCPARGKAAVLPVRHGTKQLWGQWEPLLVVWLLPMAYIALEHGAQDSSYPLSQSSLSASCSGAHHRPPKEDPECHGVV